MFRQWMKYGTTEVVNNQRVVAYIKGGLTPVGAVIGNCAECDDLAEAVGDEPYTTPALDRPAWVSDSDKDSVDFAGVYCVEMTGADGSTTTVDVNERIGNGGLAGTRRSGSRTIAVTADLVGTSPEATAVGMEWLTSVLHPPCTTSAHDCLGSELYLFSGCPDVCLGTTDPDDLPVDNHYTDFAEISGGLVGRVLPVTNRAHNPSVEVGTASTVDGWASNNLFGGVTVAQSVGLVGAASVPGGVTPSRGNAMKATWATQALGDRQNVVHHQPTGLEPSTVYLFSAWVYVPTGSPNVRLSSTFNGHSNAGFVTAKDRWVYTSTQVTTDSAGVAWYGFETDPATVPVAGQVCYMDAMMFVRDGGLPWTVSFEGTTAENWAGNAGLGFLALPASVATEAVPAPNGSSTRAMKVTWSNAAYTGSQSGQGVFAACAGLVPGQVYTFTAQVYVPAGSPDVHADYLLGFPGSRITAKDAWVPVTFSFVAHTAGPHIGFQLVKQTPAAPPAAGAVLWIDNPRIMPGLSTTVPSFYFDGATADDAAHDYSWEGTAETSPSVLVHKTDDFVFWAPNVNDAVIVGPVLPPVCDQVTVTWTVRSAGGAAATVTPLLTEPGGKILMTGTPVIVGGTDGAQGAVGVVTMTLPASPDSPNDWRPALRVDKGQVIVESLVVTHRPLLDTHDCVTPYKRVFHNVVTVAGPTVVDQLTLGDTTDGSSVQRVEWTWVAMDPFMWHDPIPVLTSVPSQGGDPAYIAPSVELGAVSTIAYDTTKCVRPPPSMLSCADNTACISLVAPPLAPVLTDPCLANLAGTNMSRREFSFGPPAAPQALGALSWRFVNDATDKKGMRVRLWVDPDPAFGVANECAFEEEFTIEYLKAGQTLYLKGPACEDAMVICGVDIWGNDVHANALRNIRGNYGGPYLPFVIGCGNRYHVAVDVPVGQGNVTWSLDLSRRG